MANVKDLSGKRFGKLVAIDIAYKDKHGAHWNCICDCGNKTVVTCGVLNKGQQSCGCYRLERLREVIQSDLYGKVFGRLTAIDKHHINKHHHVMWRCVCECGKETIVDSGSLVSGCTKSCGCLHKELLSKISTTHGMSGTIENRRYRDRKRRDLKKIYDCQWTREMDLAVYKFFNKCVLCGSADDLSVDHVLPLSKHNGLKPGNAIILCMTCNRKKHALSLDRLQSDTREKIVDAANRFNVYWQELQSINSN